MDLCLSIPLHFRRGGTRSMFFILGNGCIPCIRTIGVWPCLCNSGTAFVWRWMRTLLFFLLARSLPALNYFLFARGDPLISRLSNNFFSDFSKISKINSISDFSGTIQTLKGTRSRILVQFHQYLWRWQVSLW